MKWIIVCVLAIFFMPVINTIYAAEYPEWEGFPPMYTIQGMVEYNGAIYCACKGGLYRYDPETQEYTLYFKNHGLLSNDVRSIAATTDALYLGFENDGLVKFHPDTGAYEQILFPEYVTNNEKLEIRKIFAKNDSVLYIGHKKGVDRINIYTKELKTFTNLGKLIPEETPINDISVFKGKIWVCTDLGLAVADEDNPDLEIADSWKNYKYADSRFNCISLINDVWEEQIFIGTKSKGIVLFNEETDKIEPSAVINGTFYSFTQAIGVPWAASDKGLYKKQSKLWFFYDSDYLNLRVILGGSDGNLWVGTQNDGLQYYTLQKYQFIPPVSGPRSLNFYTIDIAPGNVLWISTADKDNILESVVLRFENGTWTEYGTDFGLNQSTVNAVVDNSGIIWLPNWGKGMYVLQDDGTPETANDNVVRVDKDMEIFKPTIGEQYVVCADATIDKNGNIWIVNHQVRETNSGVVVLDAYPVTKHQTYSPQEDGLVTAEILQIEADDDGWVWLATQNKGLMALYVGADPYDKSDTYVKNLTTLSDGLLGMDITAVRHDLDGDVWVGTKGGLNRVKKLTGKQLKVDDVNALIGGQAIEISCIDVDSSNNKWIGTNGNGLFKLDSDNDLAAHYRQDNSGMFSDTIFSLRYDNANDVLWVGTDKGLNKFYVNGTEPENNDIDIHVYPNPFEIWGTNSVVTFTNLKSKSHLYIYTFGGELVNELIADSTGNTEKASITWNGLNFKGASVASGVYFYIGTDSKGQQFKDKMAIIRR